METTQTNMEATLWHELDEKTAETISGGGEGQAGNIDSKDLKSVDLKYERCDPGTCC